MPKLDVLIIHAWWIQVSARLSGECVNL